MLKVIIIDDEEPIRDSLKKIIKNDFSDISIIGEADSVISGLTLLKERSPDVVLLDINLPDGSGFNLLEQTSIINFQVIFITAYDQYAIKAFEFNALDYILKPINVGHLNKALEKAKKVLKHNFITKEELDIILNNYSKNDEDRQLILRESDKISFVSLKDIIRCQSDNSYTTFYFKDKTKKVISKTLKTYERLLPKTLFYRVNLSCVINLKYIKEYNKSEGGYVLLKDGNRIEVSRRRKTDLLKMLEQNPF